MSIDPIDRDADLTHVTKRSSYSAFYGVIQITIFADYQRAMTSQFQGYLFDLFLRLILNIQSHFKRTGKSDFLRNRTFYKLTTYDRSGTGYCIDHARRYSGIKQASPVL